MSFMPDKIMWNSGVECAEVTCAEATTGMGRAESVPFSQERGELLIAVHDEKAAYPCREHALL